MRLPPWVQALGATLLMQTSASFMGQAVPTVGPLLTRATGLAPERIGNLASLNYLGTVLFLAFGGPVLARLGPVRTLQLGAADRRRGARRRRDRLVARAGGGRARARDRLRALAAGRLAHPRPLLAA